MPEKKVQTASNPGHCLRDVFISALQTSRERHFGVSVNRHFMDCIPISTMVNASGRRDAKDQSGRHIKGAFLEPIIFLATWLASITRISGSYEAYRQTQ
jgi:hypothetical protein